jgi:hypothetical protein
MWWQRNRAKLTTGFQLRSALFWVVSQRVVAITDVSELPIGPVFKEFLETLERDNKLYQNVGKEPLRAA